MCFDGMPFSFRFGNVVPFRAIIVVGVLGGLVALLAVVMAVSPGAIYRQSPLPPPRAPSRHFVDFTSIRSHSWCKLVDSADP